MPVSYRVRIVVFVRSNEIVVT